jgi:hypothetical protein
MSEKGVKIGTDDGFGASSLLRDLSRTERPVGSTAATGAGGLDGNLGVCGKIVFV